MKEKPEQINLKIQWDSLNKILFNLGERLDWTSSELYGWHLTQTQAETFRARLKQFEHFVDTRVRKDQRQ